MATHHTGNFKHLTLSDRAEIDIMIEKGCSFSQMARALSKDSSTISKEIRRHRFLVPYYRCENSSKRYSFYCLDFSPVIYPQLLNPLYVCNSCSKLRICSIDLRYFSIVNLDFPQKLLPSILSM